jgi:hypothetical protein
LPFVYAMSTDCAFKGGKGDSYEYWGELIYRNTDRFEPGTLEALIRLLGNPAIRIPSREKSMETLLQLKVLAKNIDQIERNMNSLLRQVVNGSDNGLLRNPHGDIENFLPMV